MLQAFTQFVENNQLFTRNDKLILAISGGVDSVVLSHLLLKTKFVFALAHCDFQLRKESKEEVKWLEELAKNYDRSIFIKSFETREYAKNQKQSVQMAARELRYVWFESLHRQYDYRYIITAHHLNDQIETILFNFVKGSGISGFKGIPLKTNMIRRPLLFASKDQIINYAQDNHLGWREDSSNTSSLYMRNFMRHEIIPILKTINPNLEKTTYQTLEKLNFADSIFKTKIEEIKNVVFKIKNNTYFLELEKIRRYKYGYQLLYYLLKPWHFNEQQAKTIYENLETGQIGKRFLSSTHRLIKDRKHLIIKPLNDIDEAESYFIKHKIDQFILPDDKKLTFKVQIYNQSIDIPKNSHIATLDYDKLVFPLVLRKWQQGDWFVPFGMQGKKKISDFFIDKKYPIFTKENIWLLESQDKIAWIVGIRIDERFKVVDETKKVLQISYEGSKNFSSLNL